jgi:hypothetical protein
VATMPSRIQSDLEAVLEVAPGLKRAAIMFNPDTSAASIYVPSFETAARSLKVLPIIAPVHTEVEIETALIAMGREPGGSLVVPGDPFTAVHRALIISAAARNTYRRSIRILLMPETAACSPTESTLQTSFVASLLMLIAF